jgi:hypothetical protein
MNKNGYFHFCPWINCNWTPVFYRHLQNSPWFLNYSIQS